MKKISLNLIAIIFASTVASSAATIKYIFEEYKMEKLIEQELSCDLHEFDFFSKFSYETPYSAVEAKHIPINDSACINKAIEAISYRKLISKYMNDAASALVLMHFCVSQDTCLWRRKSTNYVRFPYSRYYESKYKYEAAVTLVNMYIEKYNTSINDLKVIMNRTNPSEAIGYSIVRIICA